MAHVHQISISGGGVPKGAVPEAEVRAGGIDGDRQATPKIHGGPDRAVCLFSLEVIQALQAEGHPIGRRWRRATVSASATGSGSR